MFLHYKGLEPNSSFIPSSPDCWCRWRNVVSESRRLWTSAWDFFWKVLRVANQAQRMTLLSGSTMPDRYCDEHAKACLWEIERPMSDTEGQSFHSSGTFQTFKDQDYIMSLFICLLLVRSVDVVTSISLWGRYGWKADSGVEVDGSPEKSSGDWVPVELALVPSPPTWGSCSSNTATNCREKHRDRKSEKDVFTFKRMKL